ncbi:hypothetical protein [Algiphilus sp.]|uniref:hypothetical protein n=1 Tax=Algiphilus sp. TaxID=1872431 RepID=UPI001CA738B1|nr:hypothetical protein [Algiphilus sp.]MBY8965757.1 hypothetical protein [Algiphilus acroporae]MCI5062483.1 hypothetical protein [Algiphilus sp.]MCI5102581.1 hypothetical protein [Algiphilus sp.]MCR9090527.1 hypothetical protein [Pseudomonadota bacterium]
MSFPVAVACRVVALGAACIALAACGPRAHCMGEHAYQEAETVAALQNVEDITVPRSASALQIPDIATDRSYPSYAETRADDGGDKRIVCLDSPPRLPAVVVGEEEESAADDAG